MASYSYTVTVGSTTNGNRFYLDSIKSPPLNFSAGDDITFDLMSSTLNAGNSTSSHVFGVGARNDELQAYGSTDGVTFDIDGTTYNDFSSFRTAFQASAPTTSCSLSYTIPTGTPEYLYYWCANHDNMGNFMEIVGIGGTYDSTAPASVTIDINGGDSTTAYRPVRVTITGTDSVGVQGYYIAEASTTPDKEDFIRVPPTTSLNLEVPFTLSATEEAKILYVFLIDQTNNISSFASDTIELVADPINGVWDGPVATTIEISSDVPQTSTRQVSIKIEGTAGADANIDGYFISEDAILTVDAAGNVFDTVTTGFASLTATSSYSSTITHTLTSAKDQKYLFLYFKDANGLISPPISARILYDPLYGSGTDPFLNFNGGQLFVAGYAGESAIPEDDDEYITVPYPVIFG